MEERVPAPEWEWSVEVEGEAETRSLGRRLGELIQEGEFVALTGPVGAGKTVFALGVLEGLGAEADRGSPTFILVHEFEGRLKAVHADLYRLGRRAAEEDLGLEELFAGQRVSLVEWAEQAPELWPEERLEVRLERPLTGPATRRRLTFRARGRRSVALLRALAGMGRDGC